MKKGHKYLFLILSSLVLLTGCKTPFGSKVQAFVRFKVRRWFRYEIGKARSHSFGGGQIKEGYHVIGYDPSWLVYDSTYQKYSFELMTDYVIGEYDVSAMDGLSRFDSSTTSYMNKQVLEYAVERNTDLNLMMAVTHYAEGGNTDSYRRFLRNDIAKKNLINSLDAILEDFRSKRGDKHRDQVGLLIDFPDLPKPAARDFAGFISRLRSELTDEDTDKSLLLYVVLPFDDSTGVFRDTSVTNKMRKHVDLFVLRAHTFDHVSDSTKAGPLVPMDRGDGFWVDSAVQYYTEKANLPRRKMVIEVPYYGRQWVNNDSLSAKRPLMPLNQVMNMVQTQPIDYDTNFYSAKYLTDTAIYAFEDTVTLDRKYQWVVKNNLAGISLYGCGYGHGIDNQVDEALWNKIFNNFGEAPPRYFFPAIAFLLMFFIVAIVWSVIIHWETRYALRETRGKLIFYAVVILVLILCIVLCYIPLKTVPIEVKFLALALLISLPIGRKFAKGLKMSG